MNLIRRSRLLHGCCLLGCCLLGCCLLGLWGGLVASAADAPSETSASDTSASDIKAESQSALEAFNPLIGGWRGAAQPVRNSTKGAWTENTEWVWDIQKDAVALRFQVQGGKLLKAGTLTYDPATELYRLRAELAEGGERTYAGKPAGTKLILESPADDAGWAHRLTINQLNVKRTLLLLEKRPTDSDRFTRVVEVGYTREGTSLAVEGEGEPECIVSGGKGTSSTVYKGKTYWFCCTGCRDAFDSDPDGIIAEAAERAERKKAKAAAAAKTTSQK